MHKLYSYRNKRDKLIMQFFVLFLAFIRIKYIHTYKNILKIIFDRVRAVYTLLIVIILCDNKNAYKTNNECFRGGDKIKIILHAMLSRFVFIPLHL